MVKIEGKGISKYRKIRTIATNSNGPVYGMTIPSKINDIFSGAYFSMEISGTAIILESGCNSGN